MKMNKMEDRVNNRHLTFPHKRIQKNMNDSHKGEALQTLVVEINNILN